MKSCVPDSCMATLGRNKCTGIKKSRQLYIAEGQAVKPQYVCSLYHSCDSHIRSWSYLLLKHWTKKQGCKKKKIKMVKTQHHRREIKIHSCYEKPSFRMENIVAEEVFVETQRRVFYFSVIWKASSTQFRDLDVYNSTFSPFSFLFISPFALNTCALPTEVLKVPTVPLLFF